METKQDQRLCIIGVRHDEQENTLWRTLPRQGAWPGELVFWERARMRRLETARLRLDEEGARGAHLALENAVLAPMHLLYSALIASKMPRIEAYKLGHGPLMLPEWNERMRGERFYEQLSEGGRLVYICMSGFVRRLVYYMRNTQARQLREDLLDFFGPDEHLTAAEFLETVLELMRMVPLVSNGHRLRAGLTTLPLALRVLRRFESLVGSAATRQWERPWMRATQQVLEDMRTTGARDEHVRALRHVAGRMRDEDNWRYVRAVLDQNPGARRLVLVVGTAHIKSLQYLASHSVGEALVLRSDPALPLEETVLEPLARWRATGT